VRPISLVIPTYEMSTHLRALWTSVGDSGLLDVVTEVIVVDDGSKDDTRAVLERLKSGPRGGMLRTLHLPRNVGRFQARIAGAEAASSERVLFLDTRLTLPAGFGEAIRAAAERHAAVMGNVDIDVERSVFCLYWDRSHRRIFKRHYDAIDRELTLTTENYDAYLKGTGVLLVDRDVFLETCASFDPGLLSDDTFLMKEIVAKTPITLDPRVRVQWVPRENWRSFLARLWERGPGFVEYHVFEHRGAFFWAVVAGGIVFVGLAGLTVVAPPLGALAAAGSVVLTAASTALLARSPSEVLKLAPLHVAVVGTFGAAVLRGLVVNTKRALSGRAVRQRGERRRMTETFR
jgi:glycosyltransferase involved in cell wall biosynthesis